MPSSNFENKVASFIAEQICLKGSQPVLLAVSGGADSVAMACVMVRLKEAGLIDAELLVGHVNHNLRAEAEADELFVRQLAGELGLSCKCASVDVREHALQNKLSIETAARELRLAALREMARENDCRQIAAAHHSDDNAETVIHRLLRGTGYRGVSGIWPNRTMEGVEIIRPMLCVRQSEIIDYCKVNGIRWRQDSSNEELRFTRNRIRHVLLPQLQKECKGSICEKLSTLSAACRKLTDRIDAIAETVMDDTSLPSSKTQVTIGREVFNAQVQPVRVELVRRCIELLGGGERNITASHYERVLKLALDSSDGSMQLPGGLIVRSERDKLVFEITGESL